MLFCRFVSFKFKQIFANCNGILTKGILCITIIIKLPLWKNSCKGDKL